MDYLSEDYKFVPETHEQSVDVSYPVFSRTDAVAPCSKFKYKPMFKENLNYALMSWQIGWNEPKLIIEFGLVDGAKQNEEIQVEPKSNRTLFEQALLEIHHRYNKKYREGYRTPEDKPPLKSPMLAQKYVYKKTKLSFPVGVTVKLDGIRCLVRYDDKIYYRSRNNKDYTHLSLFDEDIKLFLSFLQPNIEIDGEMFSEKLSFNKIASIFRKEVNTNNDDLREHIKYYIFDSNEELPYEQRWKQLFEAYTQYLEHTQQHFVVLLNTFWASSHEEIQKLHDQSLEHGFEGTMIRKCYFSDPTEKGYECSLYRPGRRTNILKYKTMMDEEATIEKVISGKGREAGKALLGVRDIRGNFFFVRPSYPFKEREKWFENPSLVLDKKITIVFQELSEDGVPRFPVGKCIRDYE